jgi:pantoate--beta-alanine ligase
VVVAFKERELLAFMPFRGRFFSASTWDSRLISHISSRGASPLIVRTPAEMQSLRRAFDISLGRPARVGFVPTMGALHSGHLGLIDAARAGGGPSPSRADFVVASVYVNPTQFAPHEDLSKYPRTWDADVAALAARGVDVIFAPTPSAMYPAHPPYRTFVAPRGVDGGTPEGSARPGFFRGVATVVLKLLNVVAPTEAWFGQKDGIQCIVVRALARDLNVPVAIRVAPTARAEDGLALSSRNAYLTPPQRAAAGRVWAALRGAVAAFEASPAAAGARAAARARAGAPPDSAAAAAAAEALAQAAAFSEAAPTLPPPLSPLFREIADGVRGHVLGSPEFTGVEYCVFSDALTGEPIGAPEESRARNGAVMLSVVARMGTLRLLDNVMLVGSPDDLGEA